VVLILGSTIDENEFSVSFHEFHPQVQKCEYVRLNLHYYAKTLYTFSPRNPAMAQSAAILTLMMDGVLAEGLGADTDVFLQADISDVAKLTSSEPLGKTASYKATLYFVSATQRHIRTYGLRYVQQAVFSVFALLQASIPRMDEDCLRVLNRALLNMQNAYASGSSYSSLRNLHSVPTGAYMDAVMGD